MRAALVALALVLSGCAVKPPAPVQLVVAQGGTAIDAAYNTAAQLYMAVEAKLPPATKAQAKTLLASLYTCPVDPTQPCTGFVAAADSAVATGDAANLAIQVAQANTLIAQVNALLKGS